MPVEPITERIASRVRALREAAGWTQADLASALNEYGLPWRRATVVNLEKRAGAGRGGVGGRESVTVSELLALAAVLDVPPVMLLADPRSSDPVPLTDDPEGQMDPWVALLWIIGVGSSGAYQPPAGAQSGRQLDNYKRDAWLVSAGIDLAEAVGVLERRERGMNEQDERDRNDRRHREALESMRTPLIRMHAAGAAAPPLPDHVLRRAAELDVELPGPDS